MKIHRTFALTAVIAVLVGLPLAADWPTTEKIDLDAVYRIKDEGLQRSKVMEIESYLTDVYGPRLTGSPNIKEAADWAQKTMKEWGLANVHIETWPFGRGWQNQRFVRISGDAARVSAHRVPEGVDTRHQRSGHRRGGHRGHHQREGLRHVPRQAARQVRARRRRCATCRRSSRRPAIATRTPSSPSSSKQPRGGPRTRTGQLRRTRQRSPARRTSSGSTRASRRCSTSAAATAARCSSRAEDRATRRIRRQPPQVVLAVEHYGRIVRTLEKKIPVTLQMDIENQFFDTDLNAFNVVAEIPGTDKADEVVMIGAHFDSWHTGTGATDNAAGSAVMMEAMRLLKTSGVKLRRTVRIGLWGGEEQGLLGSKAYVKAHFGDPATMQLKPEHAKFAGYFNVDNGTGAIRGVYLQGNEAVAPIFQAWMEPFKNLGMNTLTIRNTGGTDHLSYDAVGLPGFQFIQDDVEYNSRTHHSNMDVYERVQPQDMMRNAVIVATFALQHGESGREAAAKAAAETDPAVGRGTSQP